MFFRIQDSSGVTVLLINYKRTSMMLKIYTRLQSRLIYLKNKKGQTLVEYGLILSLVSIVVIAALTAMSGKIKNIFSTVSSSLTNVSS